MVFRSFVAVLVCVGLGGCADDSDWLSFGPPSSDESASPYPPDASIATVAPLAIQVDPNKRFCRGASESYARQQAENGASVAEQKRIADTEFAQCLRMSAYWTQ
jgi:hypothetical protein